MGVALLLLALPVTAVVVLLAGRASTPAGDATPPATGTPTPRESTTTPPPGDGTEGAAGGALGGLLEQLLGGSDAAQLAACAGSPTDGSDPLPDDVEAAIDQIAGQVASERRLELVAPIDPVLLSADELRGRVEDLTEEDYPDEAAELDERLLVALGAVDPSTDLRQLQVDLLGEQVAGFYDPETGELTALATDGLDATARMTLAHEIDHALTDQAIGLPELDGFEGRSDEALAAVATIEGDASLLMQRWAVQHLSLREQLGAAMAGAGPAGQLDRAPWILQQQLVFPYTAGLQLACREFTDGGWPAVDALYAQRPTTSAQVLWPDRYDRGEAAVDVADPRVPAGWELARRDQLGAADLLWLLQAPGDDHGQALDAAEDRARAWAGGELAVGTNGDDTSVAITLAEHEDAPIPLCDSLTDWYGRAHPDAQQDVGQAADATTWDGDDQDAVLRCADSTVSLAIAPDLDTARGLTGR